MLVAFKQGGPVMFAILAADVALVVVLLGAVVLAVTARGPAGKIAGAAAAGLAWVPVLFGGFGYILALRQIDAALVAASPEFREQIEAAGHREASNLLWFGGGSSAFALLVAVVALGISLRPRAV